MLYNIMLSDNFTRSFSIQFINTNINLKETNILRIPNLEIEKNLISFIIL